MQNKYKNLVKHLNKYSKQALIKLICQLLDEKKQQEVINLDPLEIFDGKL